MINKPKHKAFTGSAPWTLGMRFIALSIVVVVIVLLVTACAQSAEADGTGSEFTRQLSDGRTVTCLYYRGLSCDWEHAE